MGQNNDCQHICAQKVCEIDPSSASYLFRVPTERFTDLNLLKLINYSGFRLLSATASAASKNDVRFKSGQK